MFRRVIPKQYRDLLDGKREIRRSLQCHHRPTAIVHARRYTASTDELFQKLQRITQVLEAKHNHVDELLSQEPAALEALDDFLRDGEEFELAGECTSTNDSHNHAGMEELGKILRKACEHLDPANPEHLRLELTIATIEQLNTTRTNLLSRINTDELEQELGFTLNCVSTPPESSAPFPPRHPITASLNQRRKLAWYGTNTVESTATSGRPALKMKTS